MKRGSLASKLTVIGWREWIELPDFRSVVIKVKVDTGARSSSLHAFDVHEFERDGQTWIRFVLHPFQRDSRTTIDVEAPLLEYRDVRSSNGHHSRRPVVLTTVALAGQRWPVELTLASRDAMGFRMLLGRTAIRGRFLVDSAGSYLTGPAPPDAHRPRRSRRTS